MINLMEIRKEVGPIVYSEMERKAERDTDEHPSLWNRANARQAVFYSSIVRQYVSKDRQLTRLTGDYTNEQ